MLLRSCLKLANNISALNNSKQLRIFSSYLKNFTPIVYRLNSNLANVNEQNTKAKKRLYYGILTPQIKAVKVFSLSSSVVGIIAQPFLYNEIATSGNVAIILAVYSCFGFFTFVTPILLHFVTKKYVTHLHYKPDTDTYIAKTINFFCMSRETEFKADDVKVPDVPGMFTTLHAKGKALFFDPKFFENPEHYARIMGYDKPMDFKLYETSNNSTVENKNK